MKLHAELQATGGNTTGFQIPDDLMAALGGGGRPKVKLTVKGHEFRTSIARMGGSYWLGVSSERRAEAGLTAGEMLDVDIELDTAERTLDVPDDLALALAAAPTAKAYWDALSYSNRRWHVLQVTGAKAAETRARRVARAVEMLGEGRAR
jgi:hypothetical protein